MSVKTLHQIQQEGLDVMFEKLGTDDAIRLLRIYEPGRVTGQKTGKIS